MRHRTLITLLAFTLLAASAFCQDKTRDWQSGKLVSIQAGKPTTDYLVTGPGSDGRTIANTHRVWVYVVETGAMVYQFSADTSGLGLGEDHPYAFTIGREVRFALDPTKPDRAYLVDEKGNEFKASVVKRAAKQPAP